MISIDYVTLLRLSAFFNEVRQNIPLHRMDEFTQLERQIVELIDTYRSVHSVFGEQSLQWDPQRTIVEDDSQLVATEYGIYVLGWVAVASQPLDE